MSKLLGKPRTDLLSRGYSAAQRCTLLHTVFPAAEGIESRVPDMLMVEASIVMVSPIYILVVTARFYTTAAAHRQRL